MEDVKTLQVLDHAEADAIPHETDLIFDAGDVHPAHLLPVRKAGVHVAIGGQDRGGDPHLFQTIGDLKSLVRRSADVGEKGFYGSQDVQSLSNPVGGFFKG